MRRLLLSIISILSLTTSAYGWGNKGHDVVCYIAECNLSDSAMASVTDLLDGRSMVYYSSWADDVKYDKKYSHTRAWHYLSMEHRDDMQSVKRSKDGDLLSALEQLEEVLRSEEASREERSEALKLFIHLIGDLHQPMHLGREKDKGGDTIPVVYFVDAATLHTLWDHYVPMGAREWSYTEWQKQIDRASEQEEAEIVSGGYISWIEQTHKITVQIYRDTPSESRVFYDYMTKYTPIVEQQFLYAGLRLAYLLNDIYGAAK